MSNPSYPLVSFGLTDYAVRNKVLLTELETAYLSPTSDYVGAVCPYVNFNDFANNAKTVVPYATYEANEWVLDGTYHIMPSNPDIGYLSGYLSDGSGSLPTSLLTSASIILVFSAKQSLTSITVYFDVNTGDYCSQLEVILRDHTGATVLDTTVNPTGTSYTLTGSWPDVLTVNLRGQATSAANRFVRITAIDFNSPTWLDRSKIKEAKITEEFSPITQTLTANSLELDLFLDTADYSVTNPNSLYASLPQGMPFSVYQILNGVTHLMGVFFLDTWDNGDATDRVVKFQCLDVVGLAAKLPFYGWDWNVRDLITILNYIIPSVSNIQWSGDASVLGGGYQFANGNSETNGFSFLEPSSLRDALQKIASIFHLGVTTRTGAIYLSSKFDQKLPYRMSAGQEDYDIPLTSEVIKKVSTIPTISGIKLVRTMSTIGGGASNVTIFSQSLQPGNYVVTFEELRAGIFSIAGATLNTPANWTVIGAYAYDFNVSVAGTVTIKDFGRMTDTAGNQFTTLLTLLNIVANAPISKYIEVDITCMFSNSMTALIQNANLYDTAHINWLGDYFRGAYFQEATVYETIVHAGDIVKIDSVTGKHVLGVVEETSIELVGLRTDVKVVGVIA